MTTSIKCALAIFAHNEERNIVKCLDSVVASRGNYTIDIYVLANGCSDRTEDLVKDYARKNQHVHLVVIHKGDKCNAWNYFVHVVKPVAQYFYFMDGDVLAHPGALQGLVLALEQNEQADAAAALPLSGRSVSAQRKNALKEGCLMGNLYLLTGRFVDNVRRANLTLPVGIVGDDSLVGALVMWNLNPAGKWDRKNIVVCENAGFFFDSMSLMSWRDLRTQWKRMIRYSRRYYEMRMLGEVLRMEGIAAMPSSNVDLYKRKLSECTLAWRGYWTLFDLLALKQMRYIVNSN